MTEAELAQWNTMSAVEQALAREVRRLQGAFVGARVVGEGDAGRGPRRRGMGGVRARRSRYQEASRSFGGTGILGADGRLRQIASVELEIPAPKDETHD